jgi:hypothetical protein
LSPLVFLSIITSPLSHLLKILNKQYISLGLNTLLFAVKFGALFAGYYLLHWEVLQTLLLYSAAGFLVLLFNSHMVLREVDVFGTPALTCTLVGGALAYAVIVQRVF